MSDYRYTKCAVTEAGKSVWESHRSECFFWKKSMCEETQTGFQRCRLPRPSAQPRGALNEETWHRKSKNNLIVYKKHDAKKFKCFLMMSVAVWGVMQRWPSVTSQPWCLAYGRVNDNYPNSCYDHIATLVMVRWLSYSKLCAGAALRWKSFKRSVSALFLLSTSTDILSMHNTDVLLRFPSVLYALSYRLNAAPGCVKTIIIIIITHGQFRDSNRKRFREP